MPVPLECSCFIENVTASDEEKLEVGQEGHLGALELGSHGLVY